MTSPWCVSASTFFFSLSLQGRGGVPKRSQRQHGEAVRDPWGGGRERERARDGDAGRDPGWSWLSVGAAREPGLQRFAPAPPVEQEPRKRWLWGIRCRDPQVPPPGLLSRPPPPHPPPLPPTHPPPLPPTLLLRGSADLLGAPGSYRRSQNAAPRSGTQPSKWSPFARAGQGCQGSGALRGPRPRPIPLPSGKTS